MDFAEVPPEVNSARMYDGPRSRSMLEAADAWERLADELYGTVSSYRTAIATLNADGWQGSAAEAMTLAVAPYLRWLTRTAAKADEIAGQARAAAGAFEDAFAAVVPPAAIASNRTRRSALAATNPTGHDTPEIAALEAEYGEMWAQDAAAMYRYAAASSTAAALPSLGPPTLGYNMPALMGSGDDDEAPEVAAPAMPAIPQALRSLARPVRSAAANSVIARLLRQCKFASPVRAFASAISSPRSMTAAGTAPTLAEPTRTAAAFGRGVVVGRLVVPPGWGGVAMGAVRAIA
ncbi:PPE family protein [Mycobacterium sp. TY814]|uniref:PPE family protein n=1 Tax=unclassified Mycobacterium TaxID=2642494 RepID=UPI0027417C0A|nr:PPE family protein [Mycobacterium sp. TY814]MDP7725547.1 PPE family protein [Mycobacterium sp. TY814]